MADVVVLLEAHEAACRRCQLWAEMWEDLDEWDRPAKERYLDYQCLDRARLQHDRDATEAEVMLAEMSDPGHDSKQNVLDVVQKVFEDAVLVTDAGPLDVPLSWEEIDG